MIDSIGNLNARVTANADQFVAEFNRADREAKNHASGIKTEVDKLVEHTEKKFTLSGRSGFGHALLAGFGVGSGAQVVEKLTEQIADHWKEAAEAAKNIEAATLKQLEITKQIIGLHQTDDQKFATLEKEFERKGRELDEAKRAKTVSFGVGISGTVTAPRDFTPEEQKEIAALGVEYAKLGLEVEEAHKKMGDKVTHDREKEVLSDHTRAVKSLTEGLKLQEQAFDDMLKKQHEANVKTEKAREEADKLAEKYRELADPALRYKKQVVEINALHDDGKLKANEWADALAAVDREMGADQTHRVESALKDFFGDMDRETREFSHSFNQIQHEVNQVADAIGNSLVDAVSGAEDGWKNLGQTVIHEIENIIARLLIVKPLMGLIGGLFSGVGMSTVGAALSSYGLPMHASGGRYSDGPFIAGEQGPELIVPDGVGTVIPAGATRGLMGTAGNGVTLNMTNHFSAGVQRQELAPVLDAWGKSIIAQVAEKVGRGGSYRRAIA